MGRLHETALDYSLSLCRGKIIPRWYMANWTNRPIAKLFICIALGLEGTTSLFFNSTPYWTWWLGSLLFSKLAPVSWSSTGIYYLWLGSKLSCMSPMESCSYETLSTMPTLRNLPSSENSQRLGRFWHPGGREATKRVGCAAN